VTSIAVHEPWSCAVGKTSVLKSARSF